MNFPNRCLVSHRLASTILLISLFMHTSLSVAAPGCRSVFKPSFFESFSVRLKTNPTIREWLKKSSNPGYATAAKVLKTQTRDPYSFWASVKSDIQKYSWSEKEVTDVLLDSLLEQNQATREQRFNIWTQSENMAVFLYDLFTQIGLSQFSKELSYLKTNNLYFSDLKFHEPIKGQVSGLTFSFEKESRQSQIADYYRSGEVPQAEWDRLSVEQRLHELRAISGKRSTSKTILPTTLKPDHLSSFYEESGDVWEVKSKRFEISLPRIIGQMKELSRFLKNETHSFHLHITFEVPRIALLGNRLMLWFKYLNDVTFLEGLEEGLHANDMTQLPTLNSNNNKRKWLTSPPQQNLPQFHENRDWNNIGGFLRLTRITGLLKRNTIGFREHIYGEPSDSGLLKLGFELRDATRDLDKLNRKAESIADSLVNERWQTFKYPTEQHLDLNDPLIEQRALQHFTRAEVEFLMKAYAFTWTPLFSFERSPFFQRSDISETDKQLELEIIQEARDFYIQGLKGVITEYHQMKNDGQKISAEDFGFAIRMTITEWAKKFKPSHWYADIN